MVGDRCTRCRELISLGLDGRRSEFEQALVKRHIASCPACERFAADVSGSTALLRRAEYVPLPAPIRVALPHGRLRPGVLAVSGSVAAAAAVAILAFGVNGLTGAAHVSSTASRAQGSPDLASMRLSRRQQLRPLALDQLRVRVVVVD